MANPSSSPAISYLLATPEGVETYLRSDKSILKTKSGERYVVKNVERLSGGIANHTYRANFEEAAEEGHLPISLVLKYSPPTLPFNDSYPLTTKRGFFEYSILSEVPRLTTSIPDLVNVPKAIAYDSTAHVLALSDVGRSKTLKQILVDGGEGLDVQLVGRGLGEWLAELHLWGATPAAEPLRKVLSQNTEMANVGILYTFHGLQPADDPLWKEVRSYAENLTKSDASSFTDFVVHGDFWTGNVLVSQSAETGTVKLTVVDWEASNSRSIPWNDVGQMCSEMYQPTLFGLAGERGSELVSAFLRGYQSRRKLTREEIRMAVVRFGVHLFVLPAITGWGDEESLGRCKKLGREYIKRGWDSEWDWIQQSVLRDLILDEPA